MTTKEKAWIDLASYEQLLSRWRFAPAGDPYFSGETGKYFSKMMQQRKEENPAGAVEASKRIEWK